MPRRVTRGLGLAHGRGVRSLVVATALLFAAGWGALRHLPTTAQADVVHPAPSREVKSVAFDGRSLPLAMLRAAVSTRPGDQLDADKLAADREALIAALAARGYLAARVDPAHVVQTGAGAFVTFAVVPGPQYRVRSVAVVGASQRDAGVVTVAAGEIVEAHRIERARAALADRLAARGKPGDVEARVTRDPAQAAVDIELVVSR